MVLETGLSGLYCVGRVHAVGDDTSTGVDAMTYIKDPIELMQDRIEREIDKVDADGNYPCAECGDKVPVDTLTCMSPLGDGPGICAVCTAKVFADNGWKW